jgi:BON domain
MNSLTVLLTGAGIGGLAMYELDPEMGRRRRAFARDKMIKIQRKAGDAAAVTARDLRNRTLGSIAEGRARLTERHVPDDELQGRVRSELGFLVRYPSFVEVAVREGVVVLSGQALSDESEQLIEGVRSIRGVRSVENRVEAHAGTEDFPGLRGQQLKPKPTGRRFDLLQRRWSPTTRLFVGIATVAGFGALAYSFAEDNGHSRRRSRGVIGRIRSSGSRGMIDRIRPRRSSGVFGRIREEFHR